MMFFSVSLFPMHLQCLVGYRAIQKQLSVNTHSHTKSIRKKKYIRQPNVIFRIHKEIQNSFIVRDEAKN